MKKKFISILLAILMVFTIAPVQVFAQEEPEANPPQGEGSFFDWLFSEEPTPEKTEAKEQEEENPLKKDIEEFFKEEEPSEEHEDPIKEALEKLFEEEPQPEESKSGKQQEKLEEQEEENPLKKDVEEFFKEEEPEESKSGKQQEESKEQEEENPLKKDVEEFFKEEEPEESKSGQTPEEQEIENPLKAFIDKLFSAEEKPEEREDENPIEELFKRIFGFDDELEESKSGQEPREQETENPLKAFFEKIFGTKTEDEPEELVPEKEAEPQEEGSIINSDTAVYLVEKYDGTFILHTDEYVENEDGSYTISADTFLKALFNSGYISSTENYVVQYNGNTVNSLKIREGYLYQVSYSYSLLGMFNLGEEEISFELCIEEEAYDPAKGGVKDPDEVTEGVIRYNIYSKDSAQLIYVPEEIYKPELNSAIIGLLVANAEDVEQERIAVEYDDTYSFNEYDECLLKVDLDYQENEEHYEATSYVYLTHDPLCFIHSADGITYSNEANKVTGTFVTPHGKIVSGVYVDNFPILYEDKDGEISFEFEVPYYIYKEIDVNYEVEGNGILVVNENSQGYNIPYNFYYDCLQAKDAKATKEAILNEVVDTLLSADGEYTVEYLEGGNYVNIETNPSGFGKDKTANSDRKEKVKITLTPTDEKLEKQYVEVEVILQESREEAYIEFSQLLFVEKYADFKAETLLSKMQGSFDGVYSEDGQLITKNVEDLTSDSWYLLDSSDNKSKLSDTTDAGLYTVKVNFAGNENYLACEGTIALYIQKLSYEKFEITNCKANYDGEHHSGTVTVSPDRDYMVITIGMQPDDSLYVAFDCQTSGFQIISLAGPILSGLDKDENGEQNLKNLCNQIAELCEGMGDSISEEVIDIIKNIPDYLPDVITYQNLDFKESYDGGPTEVGTYLNVLIGLDSNYESAVDISYTEILPVK